MRISSRQLLEVLAAEMGGGLTFPDIVADVYQRADGRPTKYTVRMFEDLVWRKVESDAKPGAVQDVRSVYRRVCSVLSRTSGLSARSIRPSARLNQVLAGPGLFKNWTELSRQLDCRLPRLGLTSKGQRIDGITIVLLLVALYLAAGWVIDRSGELILHAFRKPWDLIVVGIMALLIPAGGLVGATWLVTRLWRRQATVPPFETVGELTWFLALRSRDRRPVTWSRPLVGHAVRATLARSVLHYGQRVRSSDSLLRFCGLRAPECTGCGYDLRAASDRCPECGKPVPGSCQSIAP